MVVKIAHLTSVHPPLDNRILHKECKSLSRRGYQVVLIAPHHSAAKLDGVRLHALRMPRNRFSRIISTLPAMLTAALKERAVIYHFHDPELISVGLILKLFAKRVVYDVHEDVPKQIVRKHWIKPSFRLPLAYMAAAAEKLAAAVLDGIVIANPDVIERFPGRKTVLVQNFPILEELNGSTPYLSRPFTMAYVGGLTVPRGLKHMIAAADRLRHWHGVRLLLGGTFAPPELEHEAIELPGWDIVDWRGWQSRVEVARLLDQARVGLAVLHPIPNHFSIMPTKLFEYMAAGIPVVVSDLPAWRALVESARCGIIVDPMKPEQIAEAVDWMFAHPKEASEMGARGLNYARSSLSWESEAKQLYSLYDRLVAHQK